jgi:uncharacterized phage protein gp47/JayE
MGVELPVKDFETIVQEMLTDFANDIQGIDTSDASDVAIKAKIYAARIVEITNLLQIVADNAFVQDATDTHLEDLVAEKGLTRKAAVKATGTMRFSRSTADTIDRPIPAGTIVTTYPDVNGNTIDFQTTVDGVLTAGQLSVDIPAEAVTAGNSGNVASDKVTEPQGEYPSGIESITNSAAFTGGVDQELDDPLRDRYFLAAQNPDNGGTPTDYENWSLSIAGVESAKSLPLNRGNNTIDILITANGGVPSDALVADVQSYIDGKHPTGADPLVIKPTAVAVDVTATITTADGYALVDIQANIEQKITDYLKTVSIGGIVRVKGIGNAIYDTEGVADYSISAPSANLQLAGTEMAVKGVYTLS